jgi:hypothetical protein
MDEDSMQRQDMPIPGGQWEKGGNAPQAVAGDGAPPPLFQAAGMLALPRDPDAFEQLLHPLHDAFLRTAAVMEELGPDGARYWDILHAAQELLEAMGHLENAAFAWRSYRGEHDHE